MKKNLLTTLLAILFLSPTLWAQSTETFESYTVGKPTTFTNGGQAFTLTSATCTNGGTFGIFIPSQSYTLCGNGSGSGATSTGTGYGVGTACTSTVACAGVSDKFIDNGPATGTGQSYSIKTSNAALFTIKSLYVYVSTDQGNTAATSGATFIGKKAGVGTFTYTPPSLSANTNGFTFIDFIAAGYASYNIDELAVNGGASINYVAVDNFTWGAATATLSATVATSSVTCFSGTNGTGTITASGGAGGYIYSWAPSGGTGATASGLAAGNYTISITDAALATITKVVNVAQPTAAVSATTSTTSVACFGGTNGTASVTATGGTGTLTYSWTTGATSAGITGQAAGSYTCTIKDANTCTATKIVTISQPTAAVSATGSFTNVSCFGGSNGAASVSASGGTGTPTYAWAPSGGTGATASGLGAGNYTCTISDALGCIGTKVVSVSQPTAAVSATTSATGVLCFGGTNGTASVTATGGTGTLTYSWTTGATTAGITAQAAGSYTCTIKDANTCTATKIVTISQPSSAVAPTAGGFTFTSCNGASDGKVSVIAAGGTPNYTYSWTPSGGTGATTTGLPAGVYTCTVTDANGCVGTQTMSVGQLSAITATTSATAVSCFGGTNGIASVSATGGNPGPGYLYSWAPSGGTGATASGLGTGNYTCTITDNSSCTATKVVTVSQPTAAVSATSSFTNVSCFGGSNGVASVSASGGTPTYTYSWSPSGGTGTTATGLSSGSYTCTITDTHTCTATKVVTVSQPTAALSATSSFTNVACNGGSNGVASVSASGGTGTPTYTWTPSGGNAATATGLSAGNYTCTIADANSCLTTKSFTVTAPTALSATSSFTNVACNGGSNGVASVSASGGTGTPTYTWTPSGGNAATASGLSAGNYTCTIADANSCLTTKSFTVTAPTALSATTTQTNVACFGNATAIANVNVSGGTGTPTYTWAPSGGNAATASSLTSGNYTCNITDAHNCAIAKTFTITQPTSGLSATTTQTNVACNGGGNAIASVNASGGTGTPTYTWAPSGGNAATASGLSAGNYTCTISDASSCSSIKTFTITQPTQLMASSTSGTILCNGGATTVTVSATGGTTSYSGDGIMSNVTAGSYTYTVTDANFCTATTTITVIEPTVLTASTLVTNPSCFGTCNGQITVTASGGTMAYNYVWLSSVSTSSVATGLCSGTYTCTINDANGCSISQMVSVITPPAISVATTQTNVTCNGGSNGAISLSVTGGTSVYTYTWLPGGNTGTTESNLTANNYTVMVADNNGCTSTATIAITQPNAIATTQSPTLCAGGSITVGTHTYTTAATYTDVLTSVLTGCDSTVTTNLTINNAVNASVTASGSLLTANNASASYQWIDCNNSNAPIVGATSQSYMTPSNGSYAVIVTEGLCSATSTCVAVNNIGIAQNNAVNNNISVYPNPFTNELTISSSAKTNAILFDMLGNKITEYVLQNPTQTISVGELAPGMYYLQAGTQKIKIIKQ